MVFSSIKHGPTIFTKSPILTLDFIITGPFIIADFDIKAEGDILDFLPYQNPISTSTK